jgi:hypothetical protein
MKACQTNTTIENIQINKYANNGFYKYTTGNPKKYGVNGANTDISAFLFLSQILQMLKTNFPTGFSQ